MIEVTRMNETRITVNADLIEMIEETPDTVITLTTGKKLIVKESRQELKDKVIAYKQAIFLAYK
jgi:flagellar protein FlbD